MFIYIITGIILIMFVVDFVVSMLNYNHRKQPIPKNVSDIYDRDQYEKWLNYTMEQNRLNLIAKIFSTALIVFLLVSGMFKTFQDLANEWFNGEIISNLGFLLIFYTLTTVINIPFNYYHTFVIEEKYGFNKTKRKTFIGDTIKNYVLMAILFGGIASSLNALYIHFIDQLWLFILGSWLVLVLFITVLFILNTKVFLKAFNKLTPLPEGELKTKIEELATQVGFEIKAISIMDASKRSTKLNAFFSGLGKTREVVLYDTLIEKLSIDEILSVLAHELGHAMHKDTLKMLIQRSLVFGLYAVILAGILSLNQIYQDFNMQIGHLGFGFILFIILVEPIDFLLSIPVNYLSRQAEFKADAFSCQYVDKKHMLSALRILVKENFSNLNPHPIYEKIHYSHPNVSARLEAIENLS